MIRGMQGGRAVIFYFLQPDKHGNLILRGKETPPTSTTKFIVEEYFPSFKTTKSYITPSWTGESKTFIWKSKHYTDHLEYSKNDRNNRLLDVILRMFGYSDTTHPTLERIKRMSKGEKNNRLDFDIEMENWEEAPNNINYNNSGYSSTPQMQKKVISLLQEQKLLTEGQFEKDSYPASLRRKKLLKPKIKKNITKLKCRCKNG